MPQWQKPENALRRANELLEVGKKQDALDTLHDVIKARKHRQWTKIHELIMIKHLELCVELRKPHLAKDGLFQYRNMCQQVNVKSLEDVIGSFLEMAEKKADQAREESHGLVEDIEDLDQAESPEKLLLSAVSGEGAQDRADRAVLSPWLRFLWESYRQCLELLRNNVQVETLYHKVAKQGFQFCLKYQRKAEFRKLCDNLRTHLNQIQKTQHAHYATKLSNPETLAMHQDTRLIQLDVAIQMELWQEAFKSAEDVHSLMQLSKRQAKPSTLASYYEKLALIFWKAGNTLYHAAAIMKLLQLTKDLKKTVSVEEATHLATRSLLSTLSIQWTGTLSDLSKQLEMDDIQQENQRRLASLLIMPSPPTRLSLMKDIIRLNVNNTALPTAQQLYQWLELKFDPLNLATEIDKQLINLKENGKPEYGQYIESLKQVAALKILKQVSQVYQTVTFKFLTKIIPFFDMSQMERLVVGAGKKAQMQVRVHHRSESVEFGVAEGLSFGGEEEEASSILASTQLNVPIVQSMPNEQIRQHLQQMYAALQDAVEQVDLDAKKHLVDQIRNQITFYNYHAADQHKRTLERKKRIEVYKEMAEKVRSEQEQIKTEQERLLSEQKARETEARLQQEKIQRTEQQKLREKLELERRMMADRVEKMKDPKLKKFIENLPEEEIQNLDPDSLIQKQISHLEQEKREQLAKLRQQEKKWDYLVRAMHVEEIPLLEQEYKVWAVDDCRMWEEYESQRIAKAIEEHDTNVDAYHRLHRMEKDADDVIAEVRQARAGDFRQKVLNWEKLLADTRKKRLEERKQERKAKRREEWLQQKKEQEKRKKEDEEKQRREIENKRGGGGEDRLQRFQNRREYDNRPGDREGGELSGADADKWARAPLPASDRTGDRQMVRGQRNIEEPGAAPRPKREDEPDNWRRGPPVSVTSEERTSYDRAPRTVEDGTERPKAEAAWRRREPANEPSNWRSQQGPPPVAPDDRERPAVYRATGGQQNLDEKPRERPVYGQSAEDLGGPPKSAWRRSDQQNEPSDWRTRQQEPPGPPPEDRPVYRAPAGGQDNYDEKRSERPVYGSGPRDDVGGPPKQAWRRAGDQNAEPTTPWRSQQQGPPAPPPAEADSLADRGERPAYRPSQQNFEERRERAPYGQRNMDDVGGPPKQAWRRPGENEPSSWRSQQQDTPAPPPEDRPYRAAAGQFEEKRGERPPYGGGQPRNLDDVGGPPKQQAWRRSGGETEPTAWRTQQGPPAEDRERPPAYRPTVGGGQQHFDENRERPAYGQRGYDDADRPRQAWRRDEPARRDEPIMVRRDEPMVRRDDGPSAWRQPPARPPPESYRGPPRDDRGPPRDDRGPLRDDRGPPPQRDDGYGREMRRGPPPSDGPPREYQQDRRPPPSSDRRYDNRPAPRDDYRGGPPPAGDYDDEPQAPEDAGWEKVPSKHRR